MGSKYGEISQTSKLSHSYEIEEFMVRRKSSWNVPIGSKQLDFLYQTLER